MIRPNLDRVAVRPEVVKLSEVLIVKNDEKFNKGEIVAIGPGKFDSKGVRKPLTVKPGQKIRYGNGTYLDWPTFEVNGEKLQFIQEADICFVED